MGLTLDAARYQIIWDVKVETGPKHCSHRKAQDRRSMEQQPNTHSSVRQSPIPMGGINGVVHVVEEDDVDTWELNEEDVSGNEDVVVKSVVNSVVVSNIKGLSSRKR